MFPLWGEGTLDTPVPNAGKLQRGRPESPSRGHSPQELDAWPKEAHGVPPFTSHTDTTRAAYAQGKLNNRPACMLLDSGLSCSVVDKDFVTATDIKPLGPMKLTNADGRGLRTIGQTTMQVTLHDITCPQTFVVAESLSAPAILGCDFLTRHELVLDLGKGTFHDRDPLKNGQLSLRRHDNCMLVLDDQCPQAMPFRNETDGQRKLDMSSDYHPSLGPILKEHESLFSTQLGKTDTTKHIIDTGEAQPVKVLSRTVPFHYKEQVHTQLQEMERDGIIRPSSSPWRFPAVYVPKDNGEIRICVDYVQLNKVTKKDSYPVPRADRSQQILADKKVFSKLDLRSAIGSSQWRKPQ